MTLTKGMQKQGANSFERLVELYLKNQQINQFKNLNNSHLDEDALSAFVEGSLNKKESISIIKHLIDCSSCRKATSELVRLSETFKEISTKDKTVPSSNSSNLLEFWKNLTDKIISPVDQAALAYESKQEENPVESKKDE